MELLINEEEISNNLNLNKSQNIAQNIYENQKEFLETDIGKAVNSAIDIGLKVALPNFIEDEIIDIKNTILEQGFKEGIKEVISSGLDVGKSAMGIVTGNFENISQVQMAVKNGGIIDNCSKLLDFAINVAKKNNLITNNVATILKTSKNTILDSVSNKIDETLTNQLKAVEKLEKYCNNWNEAFNNKDIDKMNKEYNKIETNLNKIVPFENIIKQARKIENIHNLIKNNGNNFEITENEKSLAEKLA